MSHGIGAVVAQEMDYDVLSLLSPSATQCRGQGPCHASAFLSCTKNKCRCTLFLRPNSFNPDTHTLRTGTLCTEPPEQAPWRCTALHLGKEQRHSCCPCKHPRAHRERCQGRAHGTEPGRRPAPAPAGETVAERWRHRAGLRDNVYFKLPLPHGCKQACDNRWSNTQPCWLLSPMHHSLKRGSVFL